MKKILLIILLSFYSQLYAYQSTAKFTSEPKENSFFAFADLLYWKVSEAGADNWVQDIEPAGTHRSTTVYGVPFDHEYGLRLGLGFNHSTGWDTVLSYTGYHINEKDTAAGNLASAYLGNFWVNNTNGVDFGPSYQSANMNWGIDFDTIDWAVGHEFIFSSIMNLHPFLGLKFASIDQDIKTNWYNPINVTNFTQGSEKIKNDFYGLGPMIGVDISFKLFEHNQSALSILGSFSGALMYGRWDMSDVYTNNQPVTKNVDNHNITNAAPMVGGFLGLQWVGHFSKVDTTVRLGYEEQVWYDQLRFYSYNMGRLHDELSLQGGTLDINISIL